jgi:hypothetical protein
MGEVIMSCTLAEEFLRFLRVEYFVLGLIIGFVAGWIAKNISK